MPKGFVFKVKSHGVSGLSAGFTVDATRREAIDRWIAALPHGAFDRVYVLSQHDLAFDHVRCVVRAFIRYDWHFDGFMRLLQPAPKFA